MLKQSNNQMNTEGIAHMSKQKIFPNNCIIETYLDLLQLSQACAQF